MFTATLKRSACTGGDHYTSRMLRILLSVALFVGLVALIDYTLTGGHTVAEVSRLLTRMLT